MRVFRPIPIAISLGLVAALTAVYFVSCATIPDGVRGPRAEALAHKMLRATNYDAWRRRTAAVSFDFAGRHQIFWDKARGLMEVRWTSDSQAWSVQFGHDRTHAIVLKNGRPLPDKRQARKQLQTAYSHFINDTFWLNPLFHIYRAGAKRYLVSDDELRVTFSSGGVTPGDTYLFAVDSNQRVKKMTMWVKIIFLKGLWARFDDYITTETGVILATSHKVLFYNVKLTNVKMYAHYPEPGQPDRFAALLALTLPVTPPATRPTSRPATNPSPR